MVCKKGRKEKIVTECFSSYTNGAFSHIQGKRISEEMSEVKDIDYTRDFAEVFQFVKSERDDVRRMALEGLAQHSKDNVHLHRFLSQSDETATRSIESILLFMNEKGIPNLGHVLTLLINCAADCSCAESFVARGIVPRTMRLLDVLETTEAPVSPILREMAFMLLNNLTAAHVSAVASLLQVDDEDLKGFYVSRLKLFFDRQPVDAPRDVRKWILQICVNVTRVPEGQVVLSDDDEWMPTLVDLISSTGTPKLYSSLAIQALQNCANNKRTHDKLCKTKLVTSVLGLLCAPPPVNGVGLEVDVQQGLAEIAGGLLQSEAGMQALEEHNAKKILVAAAGVLHADVQRFVDQHVIPFLDDIQDAYVMHGEEDA